MFEGLEQAPEQLVSGQGKLGLQVLPSGSWVQLSRLEQ